MFYFIWISLLSLSIFFMSWLSCQKDHTWKWFWFLFISGAILQFWPWVSKYSKNLVIDALIFDSVSVIVWTLSLIFWSHTRPTLSQIFGMVLILIGIIFTQK